MTLYASLPVRFRVEVDEATGQPWIPSRDAAIIAHRANHAAFLAAIPDNEKRRIAVDGAEVDVISPVAFLKAIMTSDGPSAYGYQTAAATSFIRDVMGITSQPQPQPQQPAPYQYSLPRQQRNALARGYRNERFGRQPIADIMAQRGIPRQRALRAMRDQQLDDVPPLSGSAESHILGIARVQDITVVRACNWLKMPPNTLFTTWWRLTGGTPHHATTVLSDTIVAKYTHHLVIEAS